MACLLKLADANSRGVVTFTTQEQRVINRSSELIGMLNSLKSQYITGLHFNWHDFQFKPDSKFDFFMAGEEDLKCVDNTPFHLLPIDACNFTPKIYSPVSTDKFWDVLIIGNPVFFKRPEVALQTIRKLFDTVGLLRVLYICPMPEYKKSAESTAFYGIREYYEALFTKEEQNWFTLLTTTFNSPFPFDRQTLSVFYRNSRVFVHFTAEERRCRIAAYAWCAGLPVVGYPSVASILPSELRCQPGYFKVENDDEYIAQIVAAIELANEFNPDAYQKALSEQYMTTTLVDRLKFLFAELNLSYQGKLLDKNLDIRLGWHHQNISGLSNGLAQSLHEFVSVLKSLPTKPVEYLDKLVMAEYPERILAMEYDDRPMVNAERVLNDSLYLKPPSIWYRACFALKSRLLTKFSS